MSSTRFARTGRVRLCILMSMFLVLIMMIVIYQMSQHQLDESRAFQEGLSVQMQSLTAEKVTAEKRMSVLRTEKMSLQEKYESQLAEAAQKQQETERALQEKFDAQLEKLKLLEMKYSDLEAECLKSKKKYIADTHAFDQKLQKVLDDVHKDKASRVEEVSAWKEKLEKLHRESEHKIHALETTLTEYKANCPYVPKVQPAEAPSHGHQEQMNKPAEQTPTTHRSSPGQVAHSIEKPRNAKSFDAQVQIAQKSLGEKAQQEEPQLAADGAVSPLTAPRKSSTQAANAASVAPKLAAGSISSSGSPPLAVPPAKPERKLPENVAPIPENFEEAKVDGKGDAVDVDNAAEELPKNENNNRYANAVNEMANKNLGVAPKPLEDSGAHEVKDALNEPSFNLPAAGGGQNLFDGELPAPGPGPVPDEPAKQMADQLAAAGAGGADGGEGDDDDDVGDVAVKQPQHLLDTDNLNNEIMADQGKEFAEGIHLEDGMDEEQDEDDYSNAAARKKGGEAIRH